MTATTDEPLKTPDIKRRCPKCFGRGYTLTYPTVKGVKSTRTHSCPRCGGTGETELSAAELLREERDTARQCIAEAECVLELLKKSGLDSVNRELQRAIALVLKEEPGYKPRHLTRKAWATCLVTLWLLEAYEQMWAKGWVQDLVGFRPSAQVAHICAWSMCSIYKERLPGATYGYGNVAGVHTTPEAFRLLAPVLSAAKLWQA